MGRTLWMTRKEFRQVFRDRHMLAIIFIIPIFQLLVLAFAITTEVKHIRLLIVDLDHSAESRDIIRAFSSTDRFTIAGRTTDLRSIHERMQAWEAQIALVIPPHFGRDLRRGRSPDLQAVLDGVDGNTAEVALGYASAILADLAAAFTLPGADRPRPIRLEERAWYNPNLDSRQYMIPGIIVILLTILPMMLSAISLVKEAEIGTLEQLLVTPLKKHQILIGKLIPFLLLSYIELILVTAVAIAVFDIPTTGSYTLLGFLALLYLFTTLGLGIFISTIARSQQQAMFLAWFFMVFMILISGFFIPIENMPPVLQYISYLNPMRYFMSIIRDIFQKGSTLRFLLEDAVPLAAFGLLIFSFSVAKFRKHVG